MIYLILLLIVILEAVEDGLWEIGQKKWSKRVEGIYKVILILMAAFYTFNLLPSNGWTMTWMKIKMMLEICLLWASIRSYIFDPIMHVIAGFSTDYVGITSPLWNKIMKILGGWKTWVWRGFWLGFSIFWYIIAVR